jgi:GTPase SAR1 family protein
MPIGLRGVGKTVLLNRFVEMSEDWEMVAAYPSISIR